MNRITLTLFCCGLLFIGAVTLYADDKPADDKTPVADKPVTNKPASGTVKLLWADGAPGALGIEAKDKPQITIFLPQGETKTDCAVVICPGGGYGGLAMDHEGKKIAEWFNSLGVAAFILEYRHNGKGYQHPYPLMDALRAIRTVRANAADWEINASKIGVIGFSAGGHLTSTTGTLFDEGDPNAADPVDKVSSRPDFLILCYPVIAFGEPYCHGGSMKNLIGENPPQELIDRYASHRRVTEKTPPSFIFQTDEDSAVPAENAVSFYLALRQNKVPAEMHIYRRGQHGVGLARGNVGTETWSELLRLWMINMKYL
ncbi:MAG: alpha/beta hydrolase [Planctomycetaceae bacterium]|jgi:acetyl esterase/lipase|nr:alpha/beta hydrolase [Planctomycetaceae bacterium]